ncbi:MAG: hypothetical protein IKA22_08185 [Lentisphaeria bacterium]|nr:hypothetical protein [Lentisphaeria bacterium]
MKNTDVCIKNVETEFWPIKMRLPLKFGSSVIESITCCRVKMTVMNRDGRIACGVGETPLSVGWGWPSADLSFEYREEKMVEFCRKLAPMWVTDEFKDHMTHGNDFELPHDIPHLAALISNSAFDLALHDAFGRVNGVNTYNTYNADFMNHDLSYFYDDEAFAGKYPQDYFVNDVPQQIPVWHLVGGKDLLTDAERTGSEPDDGYPVTLEDWIESDGLFCLKIKLTGNDRAWDLERLLKVGEIAGKYGVKYLSPDFNCLVKTPEYVNSILDELKKLAPSVYDKLIYVEQPFPYDLEANQIDIHSVSARKPVFMDESAHNWKFVKLGLKLGWNGVALKVCKSQTGALLSACWAKEHNMQLMVQDLSNPALAIIPHCRLAQYIGTIMGVECNAAQFYPEASAEFAVRHPYLYKRQNGMVDLSTLSNIGLGYTEADII